MALHWLRHAFAIEPASAFAATADEAAVVDRLSATVARRGLTMPATVMLESFRPLGAITAQMLWFSHPWFAVLTDAAGLRVLAGLLERPGAVDYLLERLQAADAAITVPADEQLDARKPRGPTPSVTTPAPTDV
jgi:hypothetical protein